MFGARRTVVLFSAALLVACEPVSEPEVGSQLPTVDQRGAVASSVTGNAQFVVTGLLRNFSFNALEIGGLVDGEFEASNTHFGGRVHGIITCFLIAGNNRNEALIGGQVTQMASGPIVERPEVIFRVVDNRPPGTRPDETSLIFLPDFVQSGMTAAQFCDPNFPFKPDLGTFDIPHGIITVHDNPPSAP